MIRSTHWTKTVHRTSARSPRLPVRPSGVTLSPRVRMFVKFHLWINGEPLQVLPSPVPWLGLCGCLVVQRQARQEAIRCQSYESLQSRAEVLCIHWDGGAGATDRFSVQDHAQCGGRVRGESTQLAGGESKGVESVTRRCISLGTLPSREWKSLLYPTGSSLCDPRSYWSGKPTFPAQHSYLNLSIE